MNRYEVLYILAANLSEEALNANIEKYEALVTSTGGEVEKVDRWGTRKFAYPINFKNEGYYVLMTFKSEGTLIVEMERQMRISDDVYRQMIMRLPA